MFVAVISKPNHGYRRDQIRKMWQTAGRDWGEVTARFAMCGDKNRDAELRNESLTHGDMIFMKCKEGYMQGDLTRKVARAMRVYLRNYGNYDLFMKVDDDTFVSTRRVCNMLEWREEHGKNNSRMYAGVFAEGPNETMFTNHTPERDPSSPWYEPPEVFSGDVYPPSAKGGPGYILSKPLVHAIITNDIADKHLLHNEDKAVGVWVDLLMNRDYKVEFVNIPGTDGYDEHLDHVVTNGTYKLYPHFLHHHLPGPTIACLSNVDATYDPELHVDECFTDPTSATFQRK